MGRNSTLRVESIEVSTTQTNLMGGCGLVLFMRYLKRIGFFRLVNRRLPLPG